MRIKGCLSLPVARPALQRLESTNETGRRKGRSQGGFHDPVDMLVKQSQFIKLAAKENPWA